MSKLLIEERPLVLLPSLVTAVGIERAVILQQIHYLCQSPRGGKLLDDGQKWTWQTYDEMVAEYFPFWSAKTVQRHILKLEKDGYLLSRRPNQTEWDATKFYRIADHMWDGRGSNALDGREGDMLDPHYKDSKIISSKTTCKNTLAIAQDDSIQDAGHAIDSFSPEKEKSSAPPAVLAVREVCKRFPPKPIWHVIQDAIGDTPDIDRLQKTYEGWVLNGFKPTNYAWATDWYPKGITSKQEAYQTEVKKTERSYNYVKGQPTQREAIAAEQEMLAKIYESTTRS